jgi:endoglucanase
LFSLLRELCEAPGVSGDETAAAEAAGRRLAELGPVRRTALGGVFCDVQTRADENAPVVVLTAHLDRIGLMVTRVTGQGFLRVAPCGGPDRRSLFAARVTVHAKGGKIQGVVCSVPPHLSCGKEKNLPAPEDVAVDIGFSEERARALVEPGDRITFDQALYPCTAGAFRARRLITRAGCAAVIRAAGLLREAPVRVIVALTSMEETGSAGAAAAAFASAPHTAFVVDVSMADMPGERPEQCGVLGGGPMVGFAPVLDRSLSRLLTDTAKDKIYPVSAGNHGQSAPERTRMRSRRRARACARRLFPSRCAICIRPRSSWCCRISRTPPGFWPP